MDIEDQILLSRLDGFLDAASLVVSTKREFMCAAVLVENLFRDASIVESLKELYSDQAVSITFVSAFEDWFARLEVELDTLFLVVDERLRAGIIWKKMEILRILTERKKVEHVGKYLISLPEFKGLCYVLEVEGDLIVMQFFNRVQKR
ncbi:hypothetical protein [Pseudoteredinibacter isoporae]|uniref:hypothetical protein n=1 Tax=Pseudoteredinibacter isoporae TaxID=570281 RepID=UPI0031049B4E